MSEHSGGSFWLDAVLYDSSPPKADALLDRASYQENALLADIAGQNASDWSTTTERPTHMT